jgi:hypothetical protein
MAFHARVIALPMDVLTFRYLADDYFYYLGAAYHIARGEGSSVDGITTTNGYQPLFLACLVAVFRLGAGKASAVYAGLIIQMLSAAAAAWGAFVLCARRGHDWTGALAAGLISLNLFFILPTLTGFEMALALALTIWTLWSWDSHASPIVIGALAGLAVLARVDVLLLAAVFFLVMAWQRRWVEIGRGAAAFLVVVGPWVAWSIVRFGSISPDSGLIKAHVRGLSSAALSLSTAAHALPRVVLPGRVVEALASDGVSWMLSVLAGAIVLTTAWQARRSQNRVMAVFAAGLVGAYVLLIDPHEPGSLVRYLFPVCALVVLIAGHASWIRHPVIVIAILAAHVFDLAVYTNWERTAPLPKSFVGTAAMVMPAEIARVVPEGEPVAAFDSGALGYFADRAVINLDGLANHDIIELRRRCAGTQAACLLDYMRGKGVRVLAGGTAFGWTGAFRDWRTWERLYESPRMDDGSTIVLLRLP